MKVFIGWEIQGVSDHCTKTWNFQFVQECFWAEMETIFKKEVKKFPVHNTIYTIEEFYVLWVMTYMKIQTSPAVFWLVEFIVVYNISRSI